MKHRLTPFACILALCALTTCSNPELLTLLRAPSELRSLEIVAYAGDTQLEGGAAMEPGFTSSVFDYTVYVSKDTERFTVEAKLNGKGTIDIMCAEDQETGKEHDFFLDEESKVMILTVEREYMEVAEYRVTVIREEAVPVATGVEIHITPAIAAFFIGSEVFPEFEVKANLPAAGGELSYQWYMNTVNSNRGGSRINGATDATYTMRSSATMIARTVYYYAEIINTIDGKTGVTESLPCGVTFLDKEGDLHEKSRGTMVNIPAGDVTPEKVTDGSVVYWDSNLPQTWSTPGFSMGQYLVTWELWKYVFEHAEAGGYHFAKTGRQGADSTDNYSSVGNELNPVSAIDWREAMVWCNAYSEMDGRAPVYRDSNGNVFRDSREPVEILVDETETTGNGYRLPTAEEWLYAARGANPSTSPPWTDWYPGTNELDEWDQYSWQRALEIDPTTTVLATIEVGSLLPNSIGLYDMMGMINQALHAFPVPSAAGLDFARGASLEEGRWNTSYGALGMNFYGLRIACSQGGAE